METDKLYYRVDRRHINMVRFIFEAYEGVAVVTTLDAAAGFIVLAVAPGAQDTARAVMTSLAKTFKIEACSGFPASSSPETAQNGQTG